MAQPNPNFMKQLERFHEAGLFAKLHAEFNQAELQTDSASGGSMGGSTGNVTVTKEGNVCSMHVRMDGAMSVTHPVYKGMYVACACVLYGCWVCMG